MTVREFINQITDGSFTKNDVLLQSEQYPDKNDLYWELLVAQTFTKSDTEYDRLYRAMEWIRDQYHTLISYPDEGVDKIINAVDPIQHQDEAQILQMQAQEPLETVHQVNVPSDRKPGKPKKKISFIPVINKEHPVTHQPQDPDRILATLHSLIDGKIGKDVAMVIQAAIMTGKITKPQYSQVASEFGDIGHRSGYDKYMAIRFADIEINGMMRQFESL